jgi:hypothetical protein
MLLITTRLAWIPEIAGASGKDAGVNGAWSGIGGSVGITTTKPNTLAADEHK